MRKNLEREIAAAALGGGSGREAAKPLIAKGLVAYRTARLGLRNAGLEEALLRAPPGRRDYVRVRLPRGASVRLHLAPTGTGATRPMPLLTVFSRDGGMALYMEPTAAAGELARRAGTDIETIVRVVLGIERARRRLYELCEEGTRWL